MLISPGELEAIDDWRFKNRVGTRSDAIRRLCQIAIGLEPLVVDLKKLWENVLRANADVQDHLMDAAENDDKITGKESLLKAIEAVQQLNPASMELAVHATAMGNVLASLKSGESIDHDIEDVKRRIRENDELRRDVKKEWGPKE